MKRARVAEDFNPVYPYGSESSPNVPFISPPFVSSEGLQENPPGVLALKYQDPITTSAEGKLTLKLGSGVSLNDGALTTTAPPVAAPLTSTQGTIGLNSSPPLTVSAGSLTLAQSEPLTVTSNALTLAYSSPLAVSSGALTLTNPSQPLTLSSGSLTLTQTPPLTVTSGALGLAYTSPLALTDSSLGLSYRDPLNLTDDNALTLNAAAPLQVTNNALALTSSPPLTVANNSLGLNLGNGLGTSNSQLVVKAGGGIAFDSSGNIRINAAGGMRVNDSNTLILHVAYPFEATNQLTIRLGPGLNVNTNHQLQVNSGPGLTFSNNALQVSVDTSKGLQYATTGSSISVKVGAGLRFDSNGAIALNSTTRSLPDLRPLSLWSYPIRANCTVYEPLDAQLALCLSKCGSHVLGTVSLQPLSGQLATAMPTESLTLQLLFDEQGALLHTGPLEPTAWGYREDNALSPDPVTHALEFMPSALAYPRAADPPHFSAQFLPSSPPVTFSVAYNSAPSGFALTLTWSATPGQPFSAPLATFAYVSEQ
ncbi:fiber 1 [Simian adenovirus A1173]|uniref:Fiber 1 n=1 Tax=Simian adenovirus A1173 TaxID=1159188 RepID=H9AAG4_9ADEN|nr:fiber 1 [Simian adenovirus A1173]